MNHVRNRCRLLTAAVLLLTMTTALQAQPPALKRLLDSFYMVKEPARRMEIYNESLKQWPDTGGNRTGYNFARSVIAKEYAVANNLAAAQQWMDMVKETGRPGMFSVQPRLKLEIANIMIGNRDTAYGIAQLQPWADNLYNDITTTGKPGLFYDLVMVVYTPVLLSRNQPAQVVKYLTPYYEYSKHSFSYDREAVMRTPKGKYDLQTNLSVQYAKALSLTGNSKGAIQVLSAMQASGLYNQDQLANIVAGYAGKVKKNYAGKVLDSLKKSNLVRLAKFQQYKQDIDGNKIDLKAIHAKYVLLDFWGSWCRPCRASHPHLKELYTAYKDKGFEIIGIAQEHATDTAQIQQNWKKAIEEDGLTWKQVLNNKNGKQFDAVTEFGITAFPTKILLDGEGNIVATFIGNGGNELGDKLHELLNAKN